MKISEHQLQVQIINYLRARHIFCFAVPNGFYSGAKNKFSYIKKRKDEGLTPGVSDIIVLLPNAKTIFLELKVEKNGQNPAQYLFQKRVEELGFKYYLIRSQEELMNCQEFKFS